MKKLVGKTAQGKPVEATGGEFDARAELAALMNAEIAPELSEKAAALLEITMQGRNLTPEQVRRLSIQLSLSDDLGILENIGGLVYPDDDAANLTLLSIKNSRRRKTSTPAETARDFLKGVENLNTNKVILSPALFEAPQSSLYRAFIGEREQRLIEQGQTLFGDYLGLAAGSNMQYAVKLTIGEFLSKESDYCGTIATLGGIPPEICETLFHITPPKVERKSGEFISAPAVLIPVADSIRKAQGKGNGDNIGKRDYKLFNDALDAYQKKYYLRLLGPKQVIGTPAIISKFPIIEKVNEGAYGERSYMYYLLFLSPDFATEAASVGEGEKPRPKEYRTIKSGTSGKRTGNKILNSLDQFAIDNQKRINPEKKRYSFTIERDKLVGYLLEQNPDYKDRKKRLNDDFIKAVKEINSGETPRGYKIDFIGSKTIKFTYEKE